MTSQVNQRGSVQYAIQFCWRRGQQAIGNMLNNIKHALKKIGLMSLIKRISRLQVTTNSTHAPVRCCSAVRYRLWLTLACLYHSGQ